MTTIKEVLIEARKKVEQGWTQGVYARLANGTPASLTESDATCWCTSGAIYASLMPQTFAFEARRVFIDANDLAVGIAEWNDAPGRTQAEVLAAFDKAIAEAI
jgi:hypothetical protein